jgi:hypothetical protein
VDVSVQREDLIGALTPLNSPAFFEQVFIDNGAIAWPGEIDLAPDALHANIVHNRRDLSADILQG